MPAEMAGAARRGVARVVLTYAGFGTAWILLSDRLVAAVVPAGRTAELVGTAKGWAFVLVTATFLFVGLTRLTHRLAHLEAAARRELLDRLRQQADHVAERSEAERRWMLALDAAGHGVWDHDVATGRTYYSPRFKAMLGYEDHEITDDPTEWDRRVHPDDLPAVAALVEQVMAGELSSFHNEHRMQHRDGSWIWVLDQGEVVERSTDGRARRLLGTHTDVTWRVDAQRELDQHRHHLTELVAQRTAQLAEANAELERRATQVEDLYDRAPCGYHSVDDNGTVVDVNATELRWLGYERGEVVGRPVTALLAPESLPVFAESFAAFRVTGEVHDLELTFLRRDGSRLPAVIAASALRDEHGRLVRSRTTVFDDTERQERTRRIRALNDALHERAEEADRANRAKSVFLTTMSHEMRTPLHAIVGLADLVAFEDDGERRRAHAADLRRGVDHLARVVDDVLDLSRIEAGRLRVQEAPVDVAELVDEAVSLVRGDAAAKGLTIRAFVEDSPSGLLGDATRLRQLLLNYLANAVKFTAEGGVHVAATVRPTEEPDRVQLRVVVRDTGPGISPSDQAVVFQPFEQLDAAVVAGRGSGLGLAISRRLAQLLDGDVGVMSTPGEGSAFWFTAELRRALPLGEAPPRRSEGCAGSVLVADDDPLGRHVVEALLQREGVAVVAVGDGEEAVREAAAHRYDLALLDLHMPGVDGLGAIRAIRRRLGDDRPPLVVMTAGASSEERDACLAAGADEHLAKPVTVDALRELLARWLGPTGRGMSRLAGLRHADGDAALLARWTASFVEHHRTSAATLVDPTTTERELRALAHRLEGSAGLVGATVVARRAAELREVLRAAAPTDDEPMAARRRLAEGLSLVVSG